MSKTGPHDDREKTSLDQGLESGPTSVDAALGDAAPPTVITREPGPPASVPPRPLEAWAEKLVGTRLGEYDVLELLGEGGMGIVYRGVQALIGKQVAIKVLRPELADDPRHVKRLLDEARAVNAARHPGLIDIFSFGRTPEGAQYFVMELLHGESLDDRLDRVGRFSGAETAHILEQVLAALDAAHQAGVVHRDLKPSNIFLVTLPDRSEIAKVLDFGLAKIAAQGAATAVSSLQNSVAGTPEYMAPEQALGAPITPKTDLYALGVMAYELLTGKKPFRGSSAVETMIQHCETPPSPPSQLEPGIPLQLERLVLKLLAKRPADRPASAADVKRELSRMHRSLTSEETRLKPAADPAPVIEESLPPPSRPSRLKLALAVVFALAASLAAALAAFRLLK